MSEKKSEIIPYLDFLEKNKKPKLEACSWKWKDIEEKLFAEGADHTVPDDSSVALIHKDLESGGVSPNLNVLVQVLKPEASDEPHKHTNVAFFFVFQGEGYSTIDGEKIYWDKGDIVLAPAWSSHGHTNTSETEDAILITFQDVPQVSDMGVWFVEEPIGGPIRHASQDTKN